MSTWANTTKDSSSWSQGTRHTTTYENNSKGGGAGWKYNENAYTYNIVQSPQGQGAVAYSSIGSAQTWTMPTKN